MGAEELIRGAYDMAMGVQRGGLMRSDVFMLLGGLLGATAVFYGSRMLPLGLRIEDDVPRPTEYVSQQIAALRDRVITPLRPLF